MLEAIELQLRFLTPRRKSPKTPTCRLKVIVLLLINARFSFIPAQERFARINFLNFITEEYIAGFTQDGQMSNVRRFFCLFVTFDLFFISLLWLIQIMVGVFRQASSRQHGHGQS